MKTTMFIAAAVLAAFTTSTYATIPPGDKDLRGYDLTCANQLTMTDGTPLAEEEIVFAVNPLAKTVTTQSGAAAVPPGGVSMNDTTIAMSAKLKASSLDYTIDLKTGKAFGTMQDHTNNASVKVVGVCKKGPLKL